MDWLLHFCPASAGHVCGNSPMWGAGGEALAVARSTGVSWGKGGEEGPCRGEEGRQQAGLSTHRPEAHRQSWDWGTQEPTVMGRRVWRQQHLGQACRDSPNNLSVFPLFCLCLAAKGGKAAAEPGPSPKLPWILSFPHL